MTTEDRIIAEKDGSFTINVNGGSVDVNKDLAVLLARIELLEQECKALREQVNGV
jgi:uncharacterized protein (UPF0335 family)